jgi:hypothetical protein
LAPPLCSAFARTVARTAVAAEFTATSTGAITGTFPAAAGTAAEFAATTSTALTAIGAFAAVFAARLLGAGRRDEDGLVRHAEQGGELALQRGPEADRGLDRDDDGLDLDARTVFATGAVFTTRTTIAFGARTTIAFGARTTVTFGAGTTVTFTARTTVAFGARFATRAVALRDARLAAFFGEAFGAAFTRFATGTRLAFGARFTAFTRFTLFALFRSVLLGERTGEVLGQLRRVFDDAAGWAGSLTIGGRRSGATGRTTATELLRRRDGTGLGGGFGRGPDHGQRREFRVGGLQLGFVEAGCGGADFIGACVRGGLVGGDWLLALGFFLVHVAYVGAAFVVADRMMRPFLCGAATRFVGPLVTEDEPPWGAEMSRERLPERM